MQDRSTLQKAIALFSLFALGLVALLLFFGEESAKPQVVTILEEAPFQLEELERISQLEKELQASESARESLQEELRQFDASSDLNSLTYALYWRREAERLAKAAEISGSSLKEVESFIQNLEKEREELKEKLTFTAKSKEQINSQLANQELLREELTKAIESKNLAERRLVELGTEVTRQRKTLEALEVSRGALLAEMERTKSGLKKLKELKSTSEEREVVLVETVHHTVRPGETLMSISNQYYGTPKKWRSILEANSASIPDERKLKPGSVILIPKGD